MSGMAAANFDAKPSGANDPKPLVVLIDPKWNFDLKNFEVERFFEEAKVTDISVNVLQSRFNRFCGAPSEGTEGEPRLTLESFRRMNEHYSLCKPQEEEHYFRAMDRNVRRQLNFHDFLVGCSAANPATPHILNSFTGYVRARYIFDFYNVSGSGSLDFEELATLLTDTRRNQEEDPEALGRLILEHAQDLGEVSAVTVRVGGRSGPLCDLRASTQWSGTRLRKEIGKRLQVPVEGQELQLDDRPIPEEGMLELVLPSGARSVNVTLERANWSQWPCQAEATASDGVPGIERLVHVTFQRFHQALTTEKLRGTSRLFRFHRQILHTKPRGAVGGA
mmetsp:Transcript_46576/g.120557  ORF Transcript_46576/g.120557 Transcript_46576/m.120557 type:complete len:335 (-) Transcript_46576:85-1089(-)